MSHFIKLLAVWILVVATPMQGFAAASMMNCEKAHSHEAQGSTENHNHGLHTIPTEVTNHEHVADATDNHATHHSSSSKHACTHCGSVCCSSTAIVSSLLSVPPQFADTKVNLVYTAPQFTSFISAGIERPPRTILV